MRLKQEYLVFCCTFAISTIKEKNLKNEIETIGKGKDSEGWIISIKEKNLKNEIETIVKSLYWSQRT